MADFLNYRVHLCLRGSLKNVQQHFVRQRICAHRFSCLVDRFGERCLGASGLKARDISVALRIDLAYVASALQGAQRGAT